jgi:hypothetical protein
MTFRKPIAGRTFEPDNATIVSTSDAKQGVTNRDYASELERYNRDREINAIMRQRSSVCG